MRDMGGITTLGVLCVLLKRWTAACQSGYPAILFVPRKSSVINPNSPPILIVPFPTFPGKAIHSGSQSEAGHRSLLMLFLLFFVLLIYSPLSDEEGVPHLLWAESWLLAIFQQQIFFHKSPTPLRMWLEGVRMASISRRGHTTAHRAKQGKNCYLLCSSVSAVFFTYCIANFDSGHCDIPVLFSCKQIPPGQAPAGWLPMKWI